MTTTTFARPELQVGATISPLDAEAWESLPVGAEVEVFGHPFNHTVRGPSHGVYVKIGAERWQRGGGPAINQRTLASYTGVIQSRVGSPDGYTVAHTFEELDSLDEGALIENTCDDEGGVVFVGDGKGRWTRLQSHLDYSKLEDIAFVLDTNELFFGPWLVHDQGEQPLPQIQVGDVVEVTGYGHGWDGTRLEVEELYESQAYGGPAVLGKRLEGGIFSVSRPAFPLRTVTLVQRAPEPGEIQVGDTVEVTGYGHGYDGVVLVVTNITKVSGATNEWATTVNGKTVPGGKFPEDVALCFPESRLTKRASAPLPEPGTPVVYEDCRGTYLGVDSDGDHVIAVEDSGDFELEYLSESELREAVQA